MNSRTSTPIAFRSKTDGWVMAVLLGSVALALAVLVPVAIENPSRNGLLILLIAAVSIGLPIWLLLNTRYILSAETLLISSGPFRWRILIDSITAVTPASDAVSSPALSLDRIRIDYGPRKRIFISPRDKARFLQTLEALRRKP